MISAKSVLVKMALIGVGILTAIAVDKAAPGMAIERVIIASSAVGALGWSLWLVLKSRSPGIFAILKTKCVRASSLEERLGSSEQ